jgi:superfamily II DNA or RNA helicase
VDAPLRLESAPKVRSRIAQVVLGGDQTCARLGEITLRPHQQSAVGRAEAALEEFGGVLIGDDVGIGKTFVATAITRRYAHSLIVAPAALASMWRDALGMTRTPADFLSFERLSRACSMDQSRAGHDLIVVDEAHHVRNRATRRYQRLAMLAREARVVLLTATPIHNRPAEMLSLLSLFLGSRARRLTEREVARCVVRREQDVIATDIAIPTILPTLHRQISDDPEIVQELMNLPPPLPARNGGLAGALIGRGLVHQWASSEAALHGAVRRRMARAAALSASLETGNYPTARELETWTYGEGTLQLGFAELLSSPTEDAASLLACVRSHSGALQDFRARHCAEHGLDTERARILAEVREEHPDASIVAFAQYAETVTMLFTRLAATAGVAMLTARGGVVAGGKLTRDETLARFAPNALRVEAPARAERIDLLLATDLLSEGVNLQDADVVVHLDVPWTSARMEQRVGRIARMGSVHPRVHVYLIRPPASAAALLGSELLVQKKWSAAKDAIGSSARPPFADARSTEIRISVFDSIPEKTERLRGILESWRRSEPMVERIGAAEFQDAHVASVQAAHSGFVAALSVDDQPFLLSSISGRVSTDLDCQIAACLSCEGIELESDQENYLRVVNQIRAWFHHDRAAESAGVGASRARARKQLLSRIDAAIESSPPHVRILRSRDAARARSIAASDHGTALEAELDLLAHSLLPDDQLLAAVAALGSRRAEKRGSHPAKLTIHAVLLLRQTS